MRGTVMAPAQRWDADEAVTHLYAAHYTGLVRLAALLVPNSGEAEEIVQDAFVAMHARWGRLKEPDKALGYLRRSVINAARSSQRHRRVTDRHLAAHPAHDTQVEPSAEHGAMAAHTRGQVMAALDRLPRRQREVLVLRYYSDLSERDIAAALDISNGAVKSHASRGLTSLRADLEELR